MLEAFLIEAINASEPSTQLREVLTVIRNIEVQRMRKRGQRRQCSEGRPKNAHFVYLSSWYHDREMVQTLGDWGSGGPSNLFSMFIQAPASCYKLITRICAVFFQSSPAWGYRWGYAIRAEVVARMWRLYRCLRSGRADPETNRLYLTIFIFSQEILKDSIIRLMRPEIKICSQFIIENGIEIIVLEL